jgi:aspartokinase/homoserine dehydrogenase 1
MLVVHKFGGTSVGDAARIDASCRLVIAEREHGAVVVASAMSGVTDSLLASASAAGRGALDEARSVVSALRERHREAIVALELPDAETIRAQCEALLDEIDTLVAAASVVGSVGPRARDRIQSVGEKLSVRLFAARLRALGHAAQAFDADAFLDTDDVFGAATPLTGLFERGVQNALRPSVESGTIPVVTGFCGRSPDGATTTLGRGGSDYSATLVAAALGADETWIWTDVDGVLTADPRIVPGARLVEQLNYREAGELAYYGAKVLHPRTLKPVSDLGIPVRIRNSFAPDAAGTLIDGRFTPGSHPVKSISAIRGHDLLSLEGTGMAGVPGVAARMFRALADAAISVTMISQSSAESSISVAVPTADGDAAELALRSEFRIDIAHGDVEEVRRSPAVGLVAAVGLGMAHTPGIAGRVLRCAGDVGANILAIAQGSSELNITFAVSERDVDRTIEGLHHELGLHRVDTGDAEAPAFDLVLLGWGNIARELARLVDARNDALESRFGLRGRVVLVSDRSGYLLNPAGIPMDVLHKASDAKESGAPVASLDGACEGTLRDALDAALAFRLARPVVVDLTDAGNAGELFAAAFDGHADVVTANKKPLAGQFDSYRELLHKAQRAGRVLRAEATVGAGLPVVDTLEMLLVTGDRLTRADGCLSGTLAYVITQLEAGKKLSVAVREAYERGYTEPDPYADLSGADVGRKAVIISRIAGFEVPPESVSVVGVVPESLAGLEREAFFSALEGLDEEIASRVDAARERGCALRYVGRVEPDRIDVGLVEVPVESPLGRLTGTDNMIVFHSERYAETPLVVQGPGAGVDVTAMGVLGDIVRIVAERSG